MWLDKISLSSSSACAGSRASLCCRACGLILLLGSSRLAYCPQSTWTGWQLGGHGVWWLLWLGRSTGVHRLLSRSDCASVSCRSCIAFGLILMLVPRIKSQPFFFCSNASIALARSLCKCLLAVLNYCNRSWIRTASKTRGVRSHDAIPHGKQKQQTNLFFRPAPLWLSPGRRTMLCWWTNYPDAYPMSLLGESKVECGPLRSPKSCQAKQQRKHKNKAKPQTQHPQNPAKIALTKTAPMGLATCVPMNSRSCTETKEHHQTT